MKQKKYYIFILAVLVLIISITLAPPKNNSEVFSMNGTYDKNTPLKDKINSAQFGLDKKYKKIKMIIYINTKSNQKTSFKLKSPSGKTLYNQTRSYISDVISYDVTLNDRKSTSKTTDYLNYSFILNASKTKYLDYSIEFIGYK